MTWASASATARALAALDDLRRAQGQPSPDGRQLDALIGAERAGAVAGGYTLEWKTYGHDIPADLPDRLVVAGFEPDDEEKVLALRVTDEATRRFGDSPYEICRVRDVAELADHAEIARAVGRRNVDAEREQLAAAHRDGADEMGVYIAYVDGDPAASGRIYFTPGSPLAELAGGRTKPDYRRRGLFTALVAARLREARSRGSTYVIVDALPTSEPILVGRGFRFVTTTRPYVIEDATRVADHRPRPHPAVGPRDM